VKSWRMRREIEVGGGKKEESDIKYTEEDDKM
jgi:hypothetical protein